MEIVEQIKQMQTELVGQIGGFKGEMDQKFADLDRRIDGIEVKASKPGYSSGGSTLVEELKRNGDLDALIKRGRGSVQFVLEGKSLREVLESKTISSAGVGGFGTPGVMPADRDATIVAMPRPRLRMRDVLPSRPTSQGEVHWVRETARPTKASPVTEYSGQKPLAEASFDVQKEPIQTIALCFKASRQVLADYPELDGFLRNEFSARVREEEDLQILSGSGVAPNLNGLLTQGAAFDTSLLSAVAGWTYADIIMAAMQQVDENDELNGSQFAVLHPGDVWAIRRLKDTTGRYIYNQTGPLVIAGAPVVGTTQITKGTFLVGSGDAMAAEIRDRESLQVELSTEDGSNFQYNLVTVRAELRTALVVKRPDAFIQGSLTTSP